MAALNACFEERLLRGFGARSQVLGGPSEAYDCPPASKYGALALPAPFG